MYMHGRTNSVMLVAVLLCHCVYIYTACSTCTTTTCCCCCCGPHTTNTSVWRLAVFFSGKPACVTPRGPPHYPKGTKGRLVILCIKSFFRNTKLFSSGRRSCLALSAAGHAGDPPVHHGASMGPDRAPCRVLWAFKVAKSGK